MIMPSTKDKNYAVTLRLPATLHKKITNTLKAIEKRDTLHIPPKKGAFIRYWLTIGIETYRREAPIMKDYKFKD
jgi:hypothetical protein